MSAALVLVAAACSANAAPPMEEEQVNPSEVVFENGQAYADAGGGQFERLHSRKQGGETVYYRLVRYDNEFGYVANDGAPSEAYTARQTSSLGSTPYTYHGSGMYRPDFYNSPYPSFRCTGPGTERKASGNEAKGGQWPPFVLACPTAFYACITVCGASTLGACRA
jgi:hypothetical protein